MTLTNMGSAQLVQGEAQQQPCMRSPRSSMLSIDTNAQNFDTTTPPRPAYTVTPRKVRARTEFDQHKPNRFRIVTLCGEGRPMSAPTLGPDLPGDICHPMDFGFDRADSLAVQTTVPMRRNSSSTETNCRHSATDHTLRTQWDERPVTEPIGITSSRENDHQQHSDGSVSEPTARSAPQSPWLVRDGSRNGRFTITALDAPKLDKLFDCLDFRTNGSEPQRRLNSVDSIHDNVNTSVAATKSGARVRVTYGRNASISGGCVADLEVAHTNAHRSFSPGVEDKQNLDPTGEGQHSVADNLRTNLTTTEASNSQGHPGHVQQTQRGRLQQRVPYVVKEKSVNSAQKVVRENLMGSSTSPRNSDAIARGAPARGDRNHFAVHETQSLMNSSLDTSDIRSTTTTPAQLRYVPRMSLPVPIAEEVIDTQMYEGPDGRPFEQASPRRVQRALEQPTRPKVAEASHTPDGITASLLMEMLGVIKEQREELKTVANTVTELKVQMQMQADVANARIDALQEVCQQQSALLGQLARDQKGSADDDMCVQSMMNAIVTQGFDIDCLRAENKLLRSAKCV